MEWTQELLIYVRNGAIYKEKDNRGKEERSLSTSAPA